MSNRTNKFREKQEFYGKTKLPDVYLDGNTLSKLDKIVGRFRYDLEGREKSMGYQAILTLAIERLFEADERAKANDKRILRAESVRLAQQRILCGREIAHLRTKYKSSEVSEIFDIRQQDKRLGHPDESWEDLEIRALYRYRVLGLPRNSTDLKEVRAVQKKHKIKWLKL